MENYKTLITVTTTPNGDKVITMPEHIYTRLLNVVFDGQMYQESQGYNATARDSIELWSALDDGNEYLGKDA